MLTIAPLLAIALPVQSARSEVLGPDAKFCHTGPGAPAFLVRVVGFKTATGTLRVQLYGSAPRDFLAKGKWLRRIDLPVRSHSPMDVCVRAPAPGRYAIAVRHDTDGNGKSGWSDGGGFSRNPRLSLFHLKPDYEKVVVTTGNGTESLTVVLNYRQGMSIKPLS